MEPRSASPVLVHVRTEMNDHETMTVELDESNETRHLVAYESDQIRDTLASLPEGSRVPIEMVRVGTRSNVWKVVAIHGRRASTADQSVSTAN